MAETCTGLLAFEDRAEETALGLRFAFRPVEIRSSAASTKRKELVVNQVLSFVASAAFLGPKKIVINQFLQPAASAAFTHQRVFVAGHDL